MPVQIPYNLVVDFPCVYFPILYTSFLNRKVLLSEDLK
jgi:hypothetical protein